jgi:carboxypeptidase C (cathepsin A)
VTKTLSCFTCGAALLAASLCTPLATAARAEDEPAGAAKATAAAAKKPAEPPKAEQSATEHTVTIGGKAVSYTATAGTLLLRDAKDEPAALVGYIAYTLRGAADPGRRPITFAFNGGPGSSAVWLHLGALGPKRIVTADAGPTPPPPYRLVDNAYSVLDKTDLVLIDPVGSGISRAAGDAKDKDFWGVDPDIESVSRFIKQYVSDNLRWGSPKYLLGESYGTTRAAGVVDYLQTRENMAFNGVILVSVFIDPEAGAAYPGNDRAYPLVLPTFTATAAFHHLLPNPPAQLAPLLDEVRAYALGEYATALLKGDALSDQERDAVAERLHRYTGLSADFIKKAKMRVRESLFEQELLRDRHTTVGRLDSRFLGPTFDLLAEDSEYDPQSAAVSAAFTAAFLDYYHGELKFGQGKSYRILNYEANGAWVWKHQVNGIGELPLANTGLDLAHAMGYNPNLRLLVMNGLYDLATPFLATESMIDHLGLEKQQRARIQMKYYEAGHMMYVHEPALKQFKADLAAFIDAAGHP